MARNKRLTRKKLIERRLLALGWAWQEQQRVVDTFKMAWPLAKEMRASMAEHELGFLQHSILRKAFTGEL